MRSEWLGTGVIVVVCVAVVIFGVMRKRMEWLLNIMMRGILGTIAMYFINRALAEAGITLGVGINPATILTSGILGFPGLVALYGIGIYRFL